MAPVSLICGAVLTFASVPHAQATIVNINGAVSGYYPSADPVAGFTDPVQITLPAGTYAISDAFGMRGAVFGTYDEHLRASDDWFWHYVVGDAAGAVLLDVGSSSPYETRRAARRAGRDTSPAMLVLSATTTLDFAVYDNYVADNVGGISLDIIPVSVPEPASIGVFGLALAALAWASGRRMHLPRAVRS